MPDLYKPIDCNFYDRLEAAATRRKVVVIRYVGDKGQEENTRYNYRPAYRRWSGVVISGYWFFAATRQADCNGWGDGARVLLAANGIKYTILQMF
jgi:hypothetical protein